jgi:hypothetical protein
MTTLTIEGIESLLRELGVEDPIPPHQGSAVLDRPLEIPRAYLAKVLQDIVPDHASNALSAIQASTSIDAGDLCIILPKLDRTCDAELFGLDLMTQVSV